MVTSFTFVGWKTVDILMTYTDWYDTNSLSLNPKTPLKIGFYDSNMELKEATIYPDLWYAANVTSIKSSIVNNAKKIGLRCTPKKEGFFEYSIPENTPSGYYILLPENWDIKARGMSWLIDNPLLIYIENEKTFSDQIFTDNASEDLSSEDGDEDYTDIYSRPKRST